VSPAGSSEALHRMVYRAKRVRDNDNPINALVLEQQGPFCLAASLPKTTRNLRSAKQRLSSPRSRRLYGENFFLGKYDWIRIFEAISLCQSEIKENGNRSVTGGDPTSVVFSGPLYGGSPDEWVTGLTELRDRFQASSFLQLDRQRCRHRVSPKTTLVRPPVIFPPLT